jgi:RES domain-containing protein
MAEFKSYRGFLDFTESIRQEWRFVRSLEQQEFLSTVLASSLNRREQIGEGVFVWRAQGGHDWLSDGGEDNMCPFPPERMKPLPYQAAEGRANPKGMPYLYTATDQDTAIAEVRPWVGALISVAQLRVTRPLTVVNCITDNRKLILRTREPDAPERERAVWQDIDDAFSRPVTPHEHVADYVPTQVLAEFFRSQGLDGIGYRSSVGKGSNIVFFDLNAAEVVACGLSQVSSVKFTSIEASNPYFIRKHDP